MNRMWVKSLFISLYLTVAFVALAGAAVQVWLSGSLAYAGLGLTALPVCIFMGWLFVGGVSRTSANLPAVVVPTVLAGALTGYLGLAESQPLAVVVSALLVVGALLYVFWYSRFSERQQSPLQLGQVLPEFNLRYTDGSEFKSSDGVGKPGLFIFYRGNWCPLCMAQIKEVAAQYQELEKRGVQTYLISSQSDKNSADLAARFEVKFNFMVDVDNQAAKTLKIDAVGGTPAGLQGLGYDSDTAMPTVVMTNAEGKVIFLDLTDNYRVRPEPQTFLAALDAAAA